MDPRSEVAAAQAELQVIESNIAAKTAESQAAKDKNDRAALRLQVQALERQKTAATRRQKAAQVKLRKAELADPNSPSKMAAQQDDWTEHVDPGSGNPYYYNAKTGETSWTKPAQAAAANPVAQAAEPVAAGLADGWTEHLDAASGRTYYYNASTGETSWERPAQTSQQQQQQTPVAVSEPSPAGLPEGWTEHLDPGSGRTYYYNASTGVTSWDRPAPTAQKAMPAESDWTENIDPATGNKYYYNAKTGESSWTQPASPLGGA